MTTLQIKAEIQKALDSVPEGSLLNILSFLKEIQSKDTNNTSESNLDKILREDKELLKRLAE